MVGGWGCWFLGFFLWVEGGGGGGGVYICVLFFVLFGGCKGGYEFVVLSGGGWRLMEFFVLFFCFVRVRLMVNGSLGMWVGLM